MQANYWVLEIRQWTKEAWAQHPNTTTSYAIAKNSSLSTVAKSHTACMHLQLRWFVDHHHIHDQVPPKDVHAMVMRQ
jgi:hypothetical protein